MREQWLKRFLKIHVLLATAVMEPFLLEALAGATRNGQAVRLGMGQTDLGDRMWIITTDCVPARVSVLGYAARWTIEPIFSGFRAGTLAWRTRILDMRTASEQRLPAGNALVHPRRSGRSLQVQIIMRD